MSDAVWVSRAMVHASNQRPLRHSFSDDDRRLFALECKSRNQLGEPLGREYFPEEIYGAPDAKEKDYRLPDLFFAGSYWAVSGAAAAVLRQFDLGRGALYSVRVSRADHQTPIGGEWFCINFGNARSLVCTERSEKIRIGPQNRYNLPVTIADDDIAVSKQALQSPDIWVDPQLWDNFFVSNRLREALHKAKVDKGFFLTKCRVI